jgi:hypothetical protein
MAYTLDQIKNFTQEQLRSDPNLLNLINKIYTGGGANIQNEILNDPRIFDTVKGQMQKVGNPGFAISMDTVQSYQRNVDYGLPQTQATLNEIQASKDWYTKMGIDYNSVPMFSQLQTASVPDYYGGQEVKATQSTQSPTQTNTTYENNSQAQGQDFYKVKVPVTAQNPGGYDIYKSDGTKVDQQTFQALKLNDTWIPDKTGVAQSGANPGVTPDYSSPPASSSISPEVWNQLSETDKAFMASLADMTKAQYDAGQANVSISQDLLNKALGRATSEMTQKYGETAKLATAALANNLGYINAEFGQNYNATLQQQEQEKKKLSENYASTGQAISGFREQARGQLATEQQGVIASSKRQLQQQLNTLGSQYESQFGSTALPNLLNQQTGLAYTPVGGITGSQEYAKQSDILSRQGQIYNMEASPLS